MLLFEPNACENEWLVAIKALQEGKMIENTVVEKRKKKLFNLWAIHQSLKIGCKLRWTKLFKWCRLITTIFYL
jgi:hypothetical protein